MFWIDQLEIERFRSFQEKAIVQFQRGLNVVSGANGHGKTNLTKAIVWILGGPKALAETTSELQNNVSTKPPKGRLTLLSDDGSEVVVQRQGSSCSVHYNGELMANNAEGVANWIDGMFSLRKDVLAACKYVAQGELKALGASDARTRIRTVELIQGTTGLSALPDKIQKRIAEVKSEFDIECLDRLAYTRAQITLKKEALQNTTNAVAMITEKANAILADQKILEARCSEGEGKWGVWQKLHEDLKMASGMLARARIFLKPDVSVDALVNQFKEQYPDMDFTNRADQILSLSDRVQFNTEHLQRLGQEVFRLEHAVSGMEAGKPVILAVAEPPFRNPDDSIIQQRAKAYDETYVAFVTRQASVSELNNICSAMAADIEHEKNCARCGSPLTPVQLQFMKEKLASEVHEAQILEGQLNKLAEENQTLLNQKRAWDEYHQRVQSNEEAEKILFELSVAIDTTNNKISELRSTIQGLEQMNQSDSRKLDILLDLDSKIKSLEDAEELYEKEERQFTQLRKDAADYKNQIQDLNAFAVGYQDLLKQLDQKRSDYAATYIEYSRLTQMQESLKQDLAQMEAESKHMAELADKHEKNLNHIKVLERTRKRIKQFIPYYQGQTVPTVLKLLKPIMTAIGDREFDDIDLSDDFEIRAKRYGAWVDFKNLSGAQMDTAAFALRLALAKLQQVGARENLGAFILDEPTESFDRQRTENFAKTLNRITDLVGQLIIVTHDDYLKTQADHLIQVRMDDVRGSVC